MPFKSYNELISMAREDPKLARAKVAKAKQSNNPVVNSSNPGYDEDSDYEDRRSEAIRKRLSRGNTYKKPNRVNAKDRFQQAVKNRTRVVSGNLNNLGKDKSSKKATITTPMAQDEIVTKRKRVGY